MSEICPKCLTHYAITTAGGCPQRMDRADRLGLIEARWREAGCGDAEKGWLIEEVKRLRRRELGEAFAALDEVLTAGDGMYRP